MSDTTPSPAQTQFRPWTTNLVLAFYGLICCWMSYHFLFKTGQMLAFTVTFCLCLVFTIYQWQQVTRRTWGQRVEARAINELTKVVKRTDDSAISSGVMLPTGGDADALLVIRGIRFTVEIKSIENPAKVTAAHTRQVQQAGRALMSIPVIWLPRSKRKEAREKKGVHIIAGDARDLVKVLRGIA